MVNIFCAHHKHPHSRQRKALPFSHQFRLGVFMSVSMKQTHHPLRSHKWGFLYAPQIGALYKLPALESLLTGTGSFPLRVC